MINRTSAAIAASFLALTATNISCSGLIQDALDRILTDVNKTEDILANAIERLDGEAGNWRAIVQETIDQLPDAQRALKEDIRSLLADGIGLVGVEARCNVTFVGAFLAEGLKGLLADLQGETAPPPRPMICLVNPSILDLNLGPNQRNTINVFGYFFRNQSLRLQHVQASGTTDATPQLNLVSDFQLTVNLGNQGLRVGETSRRVVLKNGSETLTSIAVVQRVPEKCKLRPRNFTGASLRVVPQRKTNPWAKKRGDGEFDGNGPCIRANTSVFVRNGRELWARAFVQAWECPDDLGRTKKDYTYGDRTIEQRLFTLDAGWRVRRILSPRFSRLEYIDEEESDESVRGDGAVSTWLIRGDTGGSDLGRTAVTVNYANIRVEQEEVGDCVRN